MTPTTQTVEAVYDGSVLRPDVALSIEPNTRVRLIIEALPAVKPRKGFLETARSLQVEGPPDWSANVDKYLYGDDQPQG